MWSWFGRTEVLTTTLILAAFTFITGTVIAWSREQITVPVGSISTETRVNRIGYTVEDLERTDEERRQARADAPDVYTIDDQVFGRLKEPIKNLPVVVAQQTEFEQISPEIRVTFDLQPASLALLSAYVVDDAPSEAWLGWVERLLSQELPQHPIVKNEEWQQGLVAAEPPHILAPDGESPCDWKDAFLIRGDDEESRSLLAQRLRSVVRDAGFPRAVVGYVAAGLANSAEPTYVLNESDTQTMADSRADAVATISFDHHEGEVIYARGDVLRENHLPALREEATNFLEKATAPVVWIPKIATFGVIALLAAVMGMFFAKAHPRILTNPVRLLAIVTLMTGLVAITVIGGWQIPQLKVSIAVATTLLSAIIITLAYDQKLGLFICAAQCLLTAVAIELGVPWTVLLLTGCAVMIFQLEEVRHRQTLIRASFVTAGALIVGTLITASLVTPWVDGAFVQILKQTGWNGVASVVVGFLVLGILPSIERWFDITTGMTLAELRDPSQPLLRQLQQRAPGTYNHSLQVGNIAEAAAEAIGADSLLVYVSALYHDIGKMNKPEYFVENQSGGFNKHEKLRPAMSLLVIIGHVKDGIELAREFNLPKAIQHCIEAHHGTTLVEYFYHAAKTEAEEGDKGSVAEVEFRYPGPRPRTKEAAILMVADAVESATRAMTEPNPSRIENKVRELSRKRLLDGQFDQCGLTFRELSLIEDAAIARLCAIHHGRIAYPTTKSDTETPVAPSAPPAVQGA